MPERRGHRLRRGGGLRVLGDVELCGVGDHHHGFLGGDATLDCCPVYLDDGGACLNLVAYVSDLGEAFATELNGVDTDCVPVPRRRFRCGA